MTRGTRRTSAKKRGRKSAPASTSRHPLIRHGPEAAEPLRKLRAICLALPEATEKIAWGEPTFRVADKLFAMFTNNHHGDGRVAVWSKNTLTVQEILVGAAPEKFFKPPYVGPKGWIGINLTGKVDWEEVADLIADAYRLTAPRRLLATLPASS
jgi:predicted DNA-binding protein (MmcQ/YjbR family)